MFDTLVEFWGAFGIVGNWYMEKDSVIKLTFGMHRLGKSAKDLSVEQEMARSANVVLADSLWLLDGGGGRRERARRVLEEIGRIEQILWACRAKGVANEEVFSVLFREYGKVKTFCSGILVEPDAPKNQTNSHSGGQPEKDQKRVRGLSPRQSKIVEILQSKEKAQVWELQKVLPEVTKRTLRRDLDDLLSRKLIERQGEWNAVFYRLKR